MRDIISGSIWVLLGLGVWLYSGTFPRLPEGYPGPALFPRLIAAGLLLSGLVLLWRGLRHRAGRGEARALQGPLRAGIGRLLFGLLLVGIYPWVQAWAGTIPALSLVSLGAAWMLQVRLRVAVPTAVGGAVVIYFVFRELLGVPL